MFSAFHLLTFGLFLVHSVPAQTYDSGASDCHGPAAVHQVSNSFSPFHIISIECLYITFLLVFVFRHPVFYKKIYIVYVSYPSHLLLNSE